MPRSRIAAAEFALRWQSPVGVRTERGWPRPEDDQYAGQFADADPLYAVWGSAA